MQQYFCRKPIWLLLFMKQHHWWLCVEQNLMLHWDRGKEVGWEWLTLIWLTQTSNVHQDWRFNWTHPLNPSFNRRLMCDRTFRDKNTTPADQPSCNSTTFPVNGVRYSSLRKNQSLYISLMQLMHSAGTLFVVVHKPLLMSHMLMESV